MSELHWSNPKHPIWGFLTRLLTTTSLLVFLWANASHFDETELKTYTQWVFAYIAGEGTLFLVRKKFGV